MKEIAKTSQARFEWWVQTKFNVLPTDPRYRSLTTEQFDLMYHHFLIDNPEEEDVVKAASDPDYKEDEPEHYEDPEFMKAWDDMENDEAVKGEVEEKDEFEEV